MAVDILFCRARFFVPEKEWSDSKLLFLGNKKRRNAKKMGTYSRIGSKKNPLHKVNL
jgi:hypothetical protein